MDPTQTPQAMAAALMQGGGNPNPLTPEQQAMMEMGQNQMQQPAMQMQQPNPLNQPMVNAQQQPAMPLNMQALMQGPGGM